MDILNIFLLFLNFYTYLYVACKLVETKFIITKQNIIIIAIISVSYNFFLKLPTMHSFKIILTFVCLFFFLLKNMRKDFYSIIQTCFFIIILNIFSEQIVAIILSKFLNMSIYNIRLHSNLLIISNILIICIEVLVININFVFKKFCKNNFNISVYTIYSIFIFILIVVISLSYSSICVYFYKNFNQKISLFIITICIFFIYIYLTFLYTEHLASKNLKISKINERKYNQLQIYSKSIENLIDDISLFKHDYNNIIFMMNGFMENNDYESLKSYFKKNVFKENSYYDISKLKKIKNSGIKGLLAAKISQILKHNITVNIEILNDIEKIYINELDLCRILGIFLDNALESAQNSTEKFISLSFIEDLDLGLNITILNSYNYNDISINSMFKKGYSSKGNNRGLGLYNVRSILNEKYPNSTVLNTYHVDECMFIQDLYIKAK